MTDEQLQAIQERLEAARTHDWSFRVWTLDYAEADISALLAEVKRLRAALGRACDFAGVRIPESVEVRAVNLGGDYVVRDADGLLFSMHDPHLAAYLKERTAAKASSTPQP